MYLQGATMSYWKYAVVKRKYEHETSYEIHELYFNEDNSLHAFTENGVAPYGETKEELFETLMMMLNDCVDKEVYDYDELSKQVGGK